ncbi:hypothetical protein GGR54DRAFT_626233 [Hypoxylon sp. NC1633]|nr:hypothetical protein GGR54DRAFT_626233 [Hypoxylon sp. NC1633]
MCDGDADQAFRYQPRVPSMALTTVSPASIHRLCHHHPAIPILPLCSSHSSVTMTDRMDELMEQTKKLRERMSWLISSVGSDKEKGQATAPQMKLQVFDKYLMLS